jgi:hypothetical protein
LIARKATAQTAASAMVITESFLFIPHASLAVPLAGCVVVGVLFLVGLGIAVAIGETAMDACLTTALFISFLPTVAMGGGFDVVPASQASVDNGWSAP